MKKLILLLAFFLPLLAIAQIKSDQTIYNFASTLKTQKGTVNVIYTLNNLNTLGDKNGGSYMWDSTSVATDDGFTILQATNITKGRYLKQTNSNTIKGHISIQGVALQTTYSVSFQTPLPSAPVMIIPTLTSNAITTAISVTNKTAAGFSLNFTSVPNGTIEIDYLVIKY